MKYRFLGIAASVFEISGVFTMVVGGGFSLVGVVVAATGDYSSATLVLMALLTFLGILIGGVFQIAFGSILRCVREMAHNSEYQKKMFTFLSSGHHEDFVPTAQD